MSDAPEDKPVTYTVDVEQAVATLDHLEMVAVCRMYQRWALSEDRLSPDDRTRLIKLSSDYEAIADYAGPDWVATDPGGSTDAIKFIARLELKAVGATVRGDSWTR